MKKPKPKATSAPPKPPQTDAEALRDIVLWSADRPAWQRQALRQLAQQDQLSTDQVDGAPDKPAKSRRCESATMKE
jgi:hypothetical protein